MIMEYIAERLTISKCWKAYVWRGGNMSILANKKVVVIGDRDGVPGEAISACVETAGGEVVFSSTECFV